jgi:1-deoxy-D-xylulose-5-phosphate reductoisomerase
MPGYFEIIALSGGENLELLRKQIKEFSPKTVCTKSAKHAVILQKEFKDINVVFGDVGLEEICSDKQNDMILVAVPGKIGLKPALTAIENGIDIALANKETLVMAGDIVTDKVKANNVNLIPVDSEHSAIHQSVKNIEEVSKIVITASGGPFLKKSAEDMQKATVAQTLAHPKWSMGKKITVDSATLMNKGLEVIEAHHLFDMDYKNIEVVIHPQSIIHSAVEYVDGSVIAQLGLPSMHIPIQYALSYPYRFEGIKSKSFDFLKIKTLDFEAPDYKKFPCLQLAFEAGKAGGTYPVCLNSANEEAVFAFLDGKIPLGKIYEITKMMLDKHVNTAHPTIDDSFYEDNIIRENVNKYINATLV